MKTCLVVFGTRPEAIKMAPVILQLQQRRKFKVVVCVSGQHKDLLKTALDVFGIVPDINLDIMKEGQSLFDITNKTLNGVGEAIDNQHPDIVLVHGDTSTTFAAALAAFYKHIAVGHVEAGLRTFNLESPFPEEFNRQAVSLISTFDFCPTDNAKKNLLNSGKSPKHIYVTGNTGIDALKLTFAPNYQSENLDWVNGRKLIVLTCHRRENIGNNMEQIFHAINDVCQERPNICLIYPVHPNPLVRSAAHQYLTSSNIRLIEPLDVRDFHNLMYRSYLIMTDSGGMQEEAPSFGKPVLVLRDTTERPEGVEAGTLMLAGVTYASVRQCFEKLLDDAALYHKMSTAPNPYGDGHASERICDVLEANLI
jgi:UDP-N-acetylglucosamine 2-epimerase (non-hydrolysing)